MVGASGAHPNMGVRPDAPTIETMFSPNLYEIINLWLIRLPTRNRILFREAK